MIKGEIQHKP